jgi:hypothetical protein
MRRSSSSLLRLSIATPSGPRSSLADPFLWITRSWLDGVRKRFKPDQLQFLRLSYALGPNEGWVAVRRNRFALSIFERLPEDFAEAALGEFARMLESGLFEDTIAIFSRPGWPVREKLLSRIANVRERFRDIFAGAPYHRGYDVDVPGIPWPEFRPWN